MSQPASAAPEIVYVIGSLERGGAETHLSLIAPALSQRGWRATIICLAHRGELSGKLIAEGVKVLGFATSTYRRTPRVLRPVLLALATVRFGYYLLRHTPKITHFFLPTSYCIGAPIALLVGTSTLLMSRRSRNFYLRNRPIVQWLERQLHARMTLLLGNSKRVVSDLIEEGAPPERIQLIYNGVPVSEAQKYDGLRAPKRAELGLKDEFTIACVANLIPYKGHADLLDALARRKSHLPPEWKLLLIGRDDGIGPIIRDQANQLGIKDNIIFLGSRTDVAELLAVSDLAVLPSHEEGFSNAILEAMAAGIPIVASDVGGNAEAVIHLKTGLIVPPRDPEALGAALEMCMRSKELCQELGQAGAKRAIALFSIESCVEQYDRLYRSVAGGPGPVTRSQQEAP